MRAVFEWSKRALPALLLVAALLVACGCASVKVHTEALPPVLTLDEVLRPYHKVAVIEVHRERYGDVADLHPADYSWANVALQQEAARIGADAVIFPEVKVDTATYILYPTIEIRAKGVAIKFD